MSTRSVILASPFRLCFLLAGAMAAVWIPLWLMALFHGHHVASDLGPIGWHAHEMTFGYTGMVLAGFLLTAARNWTKRPTLSGVSLGILALTWCAGRVIAMRSADLPAAAAPIADGVFFAMIAAALARAIYGSRSKRNYAFPLLIAGLGLCDVAIHLGAHNVARSLGLSASLDGHLVVRSLRGGLDIVTAIILIFAARIIPMFTRNAVGGQTRAKGWPDQVALALFIALLALHLAAPQWSITPYVAIAAGLANAARLYGWSGSRTFRDPLLLVLHVGWLLLCLGIAVLGVAALWSRLPSSAATHVLTIGGIGGITLGMMARVTLGHTGRDRVAPTSVALAFLLIVCAMVIRVAPAVWWTERYRDALWISGFAWAGAFAAFTLRFLPVLLAPRPDGKPG